MNSSVTSVISLTIAGVLMWKKVAPKLAAILALVAGAGITGGLIGDWLHRLVDWLGHLVGVITTQAFGVAVPTVATVIMALIFAMDMWPKHKAGRVTILIGLLLPIVAVAIPGQTGSAIAELTTMLGDAGSTFVGALAGGEA